MPYIVNTLPQPIHTAQPGDDVSNEFLDALFEQAAGQLSSVGPEQLAVGQVDERHLVGAPKGATADKQFKAIRQAVADDLYDASVITADQNLLSIEMPTEEDCMTIVFVSIPVFGKDPPSSSATVPTNDIDFTADLRLDTVSVKQVDLLVSTASGYLGAQGDGYGGYNLNFMYAFAADHSNGVAVDLYALDGGDNWLVGLSTTTGSTGKGDVYTNEEAYKMHIMTVRA